MKRNLYANLISLNFVEITCINNSYLKLKLLINDCYYSKLFYCVNKGLLVGFCGISTIVGYLMPNPLQTYIGYIEFGWVGFYDISTIVGYLMPNPLYTYILDIYDLVWLGFMACQPL